MAKDPKARRWAIHYPGGRIIGCVGLLEYLFGANDISYTPTLKTGTDGKKRLQNVRRRVTASGGKQLDVFTKDGKQYQLHYSGTLGAFATQGAPKFDKSRVMGWSTKRGTMQYVN